MRMRSGHMLLAAALAAVLVAATATSGEAQDVQMTTTNVYWSWDPVNPIGTATLIRNASGITAVFNSLDVPDGQAVTLWLIIFNHPEYCDSSPCSNVAAQPNEFLADMFDPDVMGDFHYGGGHVTGASGRTVVAGHLRVGDLTGSGRVEVGYDGGVPLMDPFKAEVLLALHSHGPKLRGQTLKQQISSFLGGCQVFNGTDGFAEGPWDVPDAPGECSTMQFSLHPGATGP